MASEGRDDLKEKAIKVYRYLIRGFRPAEIGQIEKIPRSTLYWLIQEGGRILGGDLKTITSEGLYLELFLHHRERKKELWLLFASARREAAKVACLARLAEEDATALDLAERMKIIPVKGEGGQEPNVHVSTIIQNVVGLPEDALRAFLEREGPSLFGGGKGA